MNHSMFVIEKITNNLFIIVFQNKFTIVIFIH